MLSRKPKNRLLLISATLLVGAVFMLDLYSPLGTAVGVLYVFAIMLLVRQRISVLVTAAAVAIGLTVLVPLVFVAEPAGHVDYLNRGISIVAIVAAGYAAVHFDLARQGRAHDMHLQASLTQLEEKSRQLERYVFIASHNLNEPLQTITSFSDLLEEDHRAELGEDAQIYLGFITEAAAKLRAMIAGLLTYSRVGRGKKMGWVDSDVIAADLERDLTDSFAEAGGQLRFSRPLPAVWGNAEEIAFLLRELIENALRYRAPEREIVVSVTAEERDMQWILCVADNGLGFRAEDKNKVFEMFTKLYRDDVYPGQGIGLAICARIADLHLGEMWAESEQGVASRFYFSVMKPLSNEK